MANRVKFGRAKKKVDTSFNFGFNALPKKGKRAFNKSIGKKGTKAGGGS